MSIIERISQTISEKGLNQSDLCELLGINGSTYSTWKSRKTDPPAKYILLICEFLDVSPYYILSGEHSKSGYQSINSSNVVSGNNGDYSPLTVNHSESVEKTSKDTITDEMLEKFDKMSFSDKIKVMSLIDELSNK